MLICALLNLRVPSVRRGHANLLCLIPSLADFPRRESEALIADMRATRLARAHIKC